MPSLDHIDSGGDAFLASPQVGEQLSFVRIDLSHPNKMASHQSDGKNMVHVRFGPFQLLPILGVQENGSFYLIFHTHLHALTD